MLVRTAAEMLGPAERAEVMLGEREGCPAGRLRLAAFPGGARALMPGVLAWLAADDPDLDLRMTEIDPHLSVGLDARGGFDLALAHGWDVAPTPAPPAFRVALRFVSPCVPRRSALRVAPRSASPRVPRRPARPAGGDGQPDAAVTHHGGP